MQKIKVIINPASAHGQTGKKWPLISQKLNSLIGPYEYEFTKGKGHAMQISRDFLQGGGQWIISVGGDGTLNEVVNGFFNDEKNLFPGSLLSVISTGTGSDFFKSLKIQLKIDEFLNKSRFDFTDYNVDVVRLTCDQGVRFFINMASYGLGGLVVDRINRFKFLKKLGGKAGYYFVTVSSLLMHHNDYTEVISNENETFHERIQNIAIANGKFQGGGMMMAPEADIQDGLLDVIIFKNLGFFQTLLLSGKIYTGEHIHHPEIRTLKTSALEIRGRKKIPLDIDGETYGFAPCRFKIIPGSLKIRG